MDEPTPQYAPTTRAALLTFLILGPLIYLPVLMAMSGSAFFLHPLTWIIGALLWIMSFKHPVFWLVTWIPTATAAIACSFALRRLARTSWYSNHGHGVAVGIGALLCGLISAVIYFCGASLAAWIDPETPVQSAAAANLTSAYSTGTHVALLWHGVPLVAVIGALLGGALAWWSYPLNQAKNQRK
jgi:hypothetical protein